MAPRPPKAPRAVAVPARPLPPARPAYLCTAWRTPFGCRGGALSAWHPIDLLALALGALEDGEGHIAPDIDDVIIGCGAQVGAQAGNIARRAVLATGWPESVPGATVERQGASSAQAVQWAVQTVMAGTAEAVVAGGVDVMSAVPMGANLAVPSVGKPFGQRLAERYQAGDGMVTPGAAAEAVAARWSLSRGQLDDWALRSTARARAIAKMGAPYLVPVPLGTKKPKALRLDEALLKPRTRAEVEALGPLFEPGGTVTAANMAAEADGAALLLVASAGWARAHGFTPTAVVLSCAVGGGAPSVWPLASVAATKKALAAAGVTLSGVDRYEVHESSAAAALGWSLALGAEQAKVNPEGGALAWGAPQGAAGAALFVSAFSALQRNEARSALVTVAADGGTATASVIARQEPT